MNVKDKILMLNLTDFFVMLGNFEQMVDGLLAVDCIWICNCPKIPFMHLGKCQRFNLVDISQVDLADLF